jgi:hypothetical protein
MILTSYLPLIALITHPKKARTIKAPITTVMARRKNVKPGPMPSKKAPKEAPKFDINSENNTIYSLRFSQSA